VSEMELSILQLLYRFVELLFVILHVLEAVEVNSRVTQLGLRACFHHDSYLELVFGRLLLDSLYF